MLCSISLIHSFIHSFKANNFKNKFFPLKIFLNLVTKPSAPQRNPLFGDKPTTPQRNLNKGFPCIKFYISLLLYEILTAVTTLEYHVI